MTAAEAKVRGTEFAMALKDAWEQGKLEAGQTLLDTAGLVAAAAQGACGVMPRSEFLRLCEWCWDITMERG